MVLVHHLQQVKVKVLNYQHLPKTPTTVIPKSGDQYQSAAKERPTLVTVAQVIALHCSRAFLCDLGLNIQNTISNQPPPPPTGYISCNGVVTSKFEEIQLTD